MDKKKTAKVALTQGRLRKLLSFNPASGVFVWLIGKHKGKVAGSNHSDGYFQIGIDGRPYLLHRIAWLYVHGRWPTNQIDHINGIRSDNRFVNLREATNAENCQNVRAHRDGTGLLGASWEKRRRKWQAGIGINGKRIHLGYFATHEEAHQAYLAAKQEQHVFGGRCV